MAIALAQIGEFSFLLADEAMRHQLLSDDGHSLLVACAIISITLNPLLFRRIDPLEKWLRSSRGSGGCSASGRKRAARRSITGRTNSSPQCARIRRGGVRHRR